MSEYRGITVVKGPGGYGGPLTVTPDEKRNKIVYIVGGGQKPDVVDKIAELTGAIPVNGFNTSVPDDEHFVAVIDCGGSLRRGPVPQKKNPTTHEISPGKTRPPPGVLPPGDYLAPGR
ncbi:MAG TPA: PTS sorbitol transporter subunit IIB, partial [Arachnia sp.]|nr:PTS sorbitol transporter subunit IIB [Arachnia sp.]